MRYNATEDDLYREQLSLHHELLDSYHKLWQDYQAAGDHERAVKWEKKWLRLYNCRKEWIGYRAECCKGATQPVAVPVGCNDRMCPLCAWDRARIARKRIKTMFDRLTHPAFITLTIPNKATVRKHDYTLFRQRVRQFIAQHKAWIKGGVYSLETTYNRQEETWHIHAHILCDLAVPLPTKAEKITLAGERVYLFTANKLRLEFDWLRLWTRERGKKCRGNASQMVAAGDVFEFEQWVKEGRENRVREWRAGGYVPIAGLSASEMRKRTEWNARNRRVIDIRPVTDRDKAAREVLKYITKVADFGDDSAAVEAFSDATKGARLIQTFGSWYGVKLDEKKPDPLEPKDWGDLKCTCGCNIWLRMGMFSRSDVAMDAEGRWRLIREHNHNSAGTVPRPTIRALDARQE